MSHRHPLRHAPDWQQHPTVVFETDDWGACEHAPSPEAWEEQKARVPPERRQSYLNARLETPADMERLCESLTPFRDSEGRPACFTGFICLANPDFAQIREDGFHRYHDIFVSEGFPSPWEGKGVLAAWREAMARGTFAPEFHTRFHHTHAGDWLDLLRSEGAEGDEARARFSRGIYDQSQHYPEYRAMDREAITRWVAPAVNAFREAFGFLPEAGVTSDATPTVEAVWAEHGIRTFCLRNFSIPGVAPIVYHTKPWNNQDPTTPMGAWNPETDVIYLNRNIFFEPGFDPRYDFNTLLEHFHAVWQRNEPAVVSTHRLNYVNHDPAIPRKSYRELQRLLEALSTIPRLRFMTTREISRRYREGH